MINLQYEGLAISSAFKAYCYLKEGPASCQADQPNQWVPDAVICDVQLPDGDALTLFSQIQGFKHLEHVPFIVLSKTVAPDLQWKALQMGIDDFYTVGISAAELDQRIAFLRKYKSEINDATNRNQCVEDEKLRFIPLAKRAFDIVASGTALLLLSPIMLLVALMVRLDSKGPIFYVSKRVGTGYHIFDFFKFRSMRVGADKELDTLMHLNQYEEDELKVADTSPEINDASSIDHLLTGLLSDQEDTTGSADFIPNDGKNGTTFVKFENDPRVTPLGKFLRKTSLDELPQLINVLKGDMSIVGNRPLPLYEAEQLTTDQWSKRFLAPAGITGLWQVSKRGKADMSQTERMQLDVDYANAHSFWYDVKIILRTIPAMIQKESV